MELPPLAGVHHIALTVADLERSAGWYERVLGFVRGPAMGGDGWEAVVVTHPCGLVLKLMHHHVRASDVFDARRTGLDHLAFLVPTPAVVEDWSRQLDAVGVENSGVKGGAAAGSRLVVFRDPDGVQLECYYSAATS